MIDVASAKTNGFGFLVGGSRCRDGCIDQRGGLGGNGMIGPRKHAHRTAHPPGPSGLDQPILSEGRAR